MGGGVHDGLPGSFSQSMEFVVGVGSGNYFSRFVYNAHFALVPTKCVSDVGFLSSLSPEF